jgi:O-antigen/teichoic acid export membrane protein
MEISYPEHLIGAFTGGIGEEICRSCNFDYDLNPDGGPLKITGIPKKGKMVEIISFSWPLMFSSGAWLVASNTDNFFIAYYLSSSMVGIYDSAFTIARQLKVFIWSFGFLFLPMFSKLHADKDDQSLSSFYEVSTKWMVLSSIPPVTILYFHPSAVLSIIFGQEYTAGSTVLIIISAGFMIHVLTGLNGGGLSAIGESRLVMYTSIISLLPNVILNVILIPKWGIMGAAIATSFTYIFQNVSQYYYLQKEIQIKFNWKPIIATSSTTMLIYFFYTSVITSMLGIVIENSLSLISMITSILVIHLISVTLFGISDRDYEIYREIRNSKSS